MVVGTASLYVFDRFPLSSREPPSMTDGQNDPNVDPPTTTILTGVERSAIERLIAARDIVTAAELFLGETPPADVDEQQENAFIAIETLEPLTLRLATTLVAAVTKRPGGAAKLGRAVRDLQDAVQAVGPFPDTYRMANVDDGRALVEDWIGFLLSDIALENHDIDLAYEVRGPDEHVIEWRELPPHIADVELMRSLTGEMDALLMSDVRSSFEHTAALHWYQSHMPEIPDDDDLSEAVSGEQRMMEWALLDRVVPSLGSTASTAFPLGDTWRMLTPRHHRLARALGESIPGLFVVQGPSPHGVFVEDALDGEKYDLFSDEPMSPKDDSMELVLLGRLVPYDGKSYLTSPGTDLLDLTRGSARGMRSAVRNARLERADRALVAEEFVRRILGLVPPPPKPPDLTADEARELLASYETALAGTDGNGGSAARPPDLLTRDWMAILREVATRAAEDGEDGEDAEPMDE